MFAPINALRVINPGIIIGKAKTKKYNCKIKGVPRISQVNADISTSKGL